MARGQRGPPWARLGHCHSDGDGGLGERVPALLASDEGQCTEGPHRGHGMMVPSESAGTIHLRVGNGVYGKRLDPLQNEDPKIHGQSDRHRPG